MKTELVLQHWNGQPRCQSAIPSPAVDGAIRQCNRVEHGDGLHVWVGSISAPEGRVVQSVRWNDAGKVVESITHR